MIHALDTGDFDTRALLLSVLLHTSPLLYAYAVHKNLSNHPRLNSQGFVLHCTLLGACDVSLYSLSSRENRKVYEVETGEFRVLYKERERRERRKKKSKD